MTAIASELELMGQSARRAAKTLARTSTEVKNRALRNIARLLVERQEEVLAANREDMEQARAMGLGEAVLDRLVLSPQKLEAIARDVENVALLPDPVGEVFDMRTLPNGMQVGKKRVPLGVIAAIYESRPNVTVDIACLCLKAGNACILRGGKEAINSNKALVRLLRQGIAEAGAPVDAVQLVENTDRALVGQLLRMRQYIDLVVPRGGAELINLVVEQATMPVLVGGVGVCHTYVDRAADLDKALRVVDNAKTRRWTICNALDTLLVHREIAPRFLPLLGRIWAEKGIEMRCDPESLAILQQVEGLKVRPAQAEDFGKEFLAPVAAVKVVGSLEEALEHIDRYGTGHSDAIVTEDYSAAMRFLDEVDTAVVYVNASTQFTDGAQFGLGAEIIDSTQKTIARGPVGLREITTYKWIVLGNGHTRP
ncbi:MAG: glutamate-5-semialdehyde dehydrogenase [Dehalococcoidia bacterium]|jgi:glutamate-5-semialdehyde dehydrogenase|nr:glutamate-5-semialdehyde dehydrogenase [Dehalococcoidia bacterium]